MEEESLKVGIQRIKFTCNRIGRIDGLFKGTSCEDDYLKLAKGLADALYLQERHGLSPVLPDGKVGGNGAVKICVDNHDYLVVSKSGKYPGPMDLHQDFCVVSYFDTENWSCEYYSENEGIKPTSDTPMHFSVLFDKNLFGGNVSPRAAIHGHGLQSEEEAKKLEIPCSTVETLCSTKEDTVALTELIADYPYPNDQTYIRKNHGYYILGKDITDCLRVFEEKIINNKTVT